MFHQLFEGLSLGIRIAALPPPKKTHDDIQDETNCDGDLSASEETSNQRTLKNNYLWLSPFSSSSRHHHRGSRNRCRWICWKDIHWLEPTLYFLFAVTTPFGMTLGILAFGPGQRKDAGKFTLFMSCEGLHTNIRH